MSCRFFFLHKKSNHEKTGNIISVDEYNSVFFFSSLCEVVEWSHTLALYLLKHFFTVKRKMEYWNEKYRTVYQLHISSNAIAFFFSTVFFFRTSNSPFGFFCIHFWKHTLYIAFIYHIQLILLLYMIIFCCCCCWSECSAKYFIIIEFMCLHGGCCRFFFAAQSICVLKICFEFSFHFLNYLLMQFIIAYHFANNSKFLKRNKMHL